MFYDLCILIYTIQNILLGFIRVVLILNNPKPLNQFHGRLMNPGLVTLLLKCPESYQPCLMVQVTLQIIGTKIKYV
jgi:hypothetical protein